MNDCPKRNPEVIDNGLGTFLEQTEGRKNECGEEQLLRLGRMKQPEILGSQRARQTDFILDTMESHWKILGRKASCDFKIPQAVMQRRVGKTVRRPDTPVKRLLCLTKTWTRVAAVIYLKMSLRSPRGDNKYVIGYMILEGIKMWVSSTDSSLNNT